MSYTIRSGGPDSPTSVAVLGKLQECASSEEAAPEHKLPTNLFETFTSPKNLLQLFCFQPPAGNWLLLLTAILRLSKRKDF